MLTRHTEIDRCRGKGSTYMVMPDSEWDAAWIARCQEVEDDQGHVICGAPTSTDLPCRKRPIRGQVRCREHIRAAHMQGGDGGRAMVPTTQVAVFESSDRGVVERWRSTFEERLPAELRVHFEVLHNRSITAEMMMRELVAAQRARMHMSLIGEAEIGIIDPQCTAEMSLLSRMVNDLAKLSSRNETTGDESILAMARYAFDVEVEAEQARDVVDDDDYDDEEE